MLLKGTWVFCSLKCYISRRIILYTWKTTVLAILLKWNYFPLHLCRHCYIFFQDFVFQNKSPREARFCFLEENLFVAAVLEPRALPCLCCSDVLFGYRHMFLSIFSSRTQWSLLICASLFSKCCLNCVLIDHSGLSSGIMCVRGT